MGIDSTEARERGVSKNKHSNGHPIAAIEKRVIDSPAFADLTPSAIKLLILLARQVTLDNNGHLQASFSWAKKYGFASEHTLRRAIADLIAHGMIYRTRSHGANKAWAKYAITWLLIKDKKELFLSGFKMQAWRDWEPDKKTTLSKVLESTGRKCSFNSEIPAETAGKSPIKSADYELIPIGGS